MDPLSHPALDPAQEGHSCEDSALERESEETRKRITAALMSGRRMIHFANCQGRIQDPCFIGAITSKMFAARNLGSTDGKADLKLPNEIEFSLSANMGLTFRPDVEPRTRRISLMFAEENANGRVFPKPDLHGWLLRYRVEMLSAVAALVQRWIEAGCPPGPTPFSSFPEWAAVVGGIMQVNGLGDPCLPHEDDGGVPADRQTEAMRALFKACYEKHPDAWIQKGLIYEVIATNEAEEAFGWFGDLAEPGVKIKVGLQLRQFKGRELDGITLLMDDAVSKSQNSRFQFSRGQEQPRRDPLAHLFGHVGHVGHVQPNLEPEEGLLNKNNNSIIEGAVGRTHGLNMPNMPNMPNLSKAAKLVTTREALPEIAAALRAMGEVALDLETCQEQQTYAARDVAHLHDLAGVQRHELEMEGLDQPGLLEMELLPVVIEMEATGMAVDQARLSTFRDNAQTQLRDLAVQLRDCLQQPKLNPASPRQLTQALAAQGISVSATDEETLRTVDDGHVIPAILAYRAAEKQVQQATALLECVRNDGRIHGRFDPTGTATGRFSSKDPTLQNIGRGPLRACFVPAPGHQLIAADYSQIELRVAAALAGEPPMIDEG